MSGCRHTRLQKTTLLVKGKRAARAARRRALPCRLGGGIAMSRVLKALLLAATHDTCACDLAGTCAVHWASLHKLHF